MQVSVAFSRRRGHVAGVKTATLHVKSNDPDQHDHRPLPLRGLATAGTGGADEPSLQRILDLYQIPINVGDANPGDTDLFSNSAPLHHAQRRGADPAPGQGRRRGR